VRVGTAVRAFGAAVGEVVRSVLGEPIQEGRLRARHWPRGLRSVVTLALTAFIGAALLVVTARPVRQHSELSVGVSGDLVFPRWALFVFLLLTVLALALLHASSLHLAWWLRLLVLLIVVVVVLTLATDYLSQDRAPHIVTWVGCGLLVLLTGLRWRAAFAWWEFVASFSILGATAAATFRLEGRYAGPLGYDTAPVGTTLTMQALAILAVPFIVVSGVAFAQLVLLLATRVGAVVDEHVRPTRSLVGLAVLLAAADLLLAVRRLRAPTEFGAGHLAVSGSGACLLVAALAGALAARRSRRSRAGVEDLEGAISTIALPAAALTTALVVAGMLVSRVDLQIIKYRDRQHLALGWLEDALTGSHALVASRFGAGVLLIGWAVWRRDRDQLPSLLAGCVGLTLVAAWMRRATGGVVDLPWTSDSVNDAATVAAVLTLVALAVRRRLTRTRLLALGLALGVGFAWSVRSTFDAPFVALFGLGATAAVFLGVIWSMLTGAAVANEDSPRYPRPARVLFFLANGVLAMTVLAFGALGRTQSVGLDTLSFGTLGDTYLGTGLLLATYGLLAVAVWQDRPALARRPQLDVVPTDG